MTLKLFSIRDQKSGIFYPPWFLNSHGEAERKFHATVNDEKSTLNKYPEDFDFYFLGEYDDNTGKLQSLDTPQHLLKAVDMLPKQ